VYSIVVSIVIGIVEMLLLVLSIPDSTRIFMESLNQSQYNCKAGRDWREDGDPDVPVPP
jgi:hypothetical protein